MRADPRQLDRRRAPGRRRRARSPARFGARAIGSRQAAPSWSRARRPARSPARCAPRPARVRLARTRCATASQAHRRPTRCRPQQWLARRRRRPGHADPAGDAHEPADRARRLAARHDATPSRRAATSARSARCRRTPRSATAPRPQPSPRRPSTASASSASGRGRARSTSALPSPEMISCADSVAADRQRHQRRRRRDQHELRLGGVLPGGVRAAPARGRARGSFPSPRPATSSAQGNPLEFPAALPHVLTVAASSDAADTPAPFSNANAAVDLGAPGVEHPRPPCRSSLDTDGTAGRLPARRRHELLGADGRRRGRLGARGAARPDARPGRPGRAPVGDRHRPAGLGPEHRLRPARHRRGARQQAPPPPTRSSPTTTSRSSTAARSARRAAAIFGGRRTVRGRRAARRVRGPRRRLPDQAAPARRKVRRERQAGVRRPRRSRSTSRGAKSVTQRVARSCATSRRTGSKHRRGRRSATARGAHERTFYVAVGVQPQGARALDAALRAHGQRAHARRPLLPRRGRRCPRAPRASARAGLSRRYHSASSAA